MIDKWIIGKYTKKSQEAPINVFLENIDSFNEKEWNQLYKLSEEIFVEESDSLKDTAAGAGLIDND